MGSSLKNYRDSLKRKWLEPYGDAIEEARENVPFRIAKNDWNDLVDWWTNEDYMEMCLINKKNHGENKIVHTSGSKSFQQRNAEEMTLRSLTTQVNEGSLQMSEDQMFVEVFGSKHHGRV